MKLYFYLLTSLTLGLTGPIMARSCFSEHLKDSIRINKENFERYHQLTSGLSDPILKRMIAGEKISLMIASIIDKKAQIYHANAIDLFCQEFKAMKIQSSEIELTQPEVAPLNLSSYAFMKKMKKALKSEDERIIQMESLEVLFELNKSPDHHCFARHIIESIFRFAYFIPQRRLESSQKKLKDPKGLMLNMMRLQLLSLPFAHYIDRKSIPIQMNGIPLLCRELPDLLKDIPLNEIEELKNNRKNYGKN